MKPGQILIAALMVVGIIIVATGMHGNNPRCVLANLCEEQP